MAIYESDIGSRGFDFAVAVTEKAVNAMLKTYLNNLSSHRSAITVCFKMKAKDDPAPELVDYEDVKRLAMGTDPFAIPEDPSAKSAAMLHLLGALFLMGFRARIGLRPGTSQQERVVQFVNAWPTTVNYEIMVSELTIVGLYVPAGGTPTWISESSPSPTSGPWTIKILSNLTFETAASKNPAMTDNAKVWLRRAMENTTCSAFSIQQLLLTLSGGIDTTATPEISGISSNSALSLFQTMLPFYLSDCLLKCGLPILRCPADPRKDPDPSPLPMANLRISTKPYLDASGRVDADTSLATLNYLCPAPSTSTTTTTPPAFDQFTFRWNWVSPTDHPSPHGVAALSRRALAAYLDSQLATYAKTLCIASTIEHNRYTTADPAVERPGTGDVLLRYRHANTDKNKDDKLVSSFALDVRFCGRTSRLVLEQRQMCHLDLHIGSFHGSAQLLDFAATLTVELAVDARGVISASMVGDEVVNKGEKVPSIAATGHADFWNAKSFNERAVEIAGLVSQWNLVDNRVPVAFLGGYQLPGAKVFAYRELLLSDFGDVVAKATYGYPG